MLHLRLTTWHKAMTLVPLALLSGAGIAEFSAVSAASQQAAEGGADSRTRPAVATQSIAAAPQLVPRSGVALGVPAGSARGVLDDVPTEAIPPAALQAYQRASQVLASADRGCKLSWQLLAAVGRVESDHGRYGGNKLDENGRSTPGILGVSLDGSGKTARILDTDAGAHDNDRVYDRAVGPMQFIPSTWSIVGVDGDGDGLRDPQDIDDAALASAVYLCSGEEDLSTVAGQRASVYRYNHSEDYVDLVLAIMKAYLDGEYSSLPTAVDAAPVKVASVELPSGPAQEVTPGDAGKADNPDGAERQQDAGETRAESDQDDRSEPPQDNEPHDSNSRVEPTEAKPAETDDEPETKPQADSERDETPSEDEAPSESAADGPGASEPDEGFPDESAEDTGGVIDTAADDATDEAGDGGSDTDEVPAEPEGNDADDEAAEGGSETEDVPTESEGDTDGGDSASEPDDSAAEDDVDAGEEGELAAEEGSPENEQEPADETDAGEAENDTASSQDEVATPTNLTEAADACQSLLTAEEIESLGGLEACAELVLAATAGDADEPLPDWLEPVLRDAGVLPEQ
jgi:hypothetical protein